MGVSMHPHLKRQWVDALRSGLYTPGETYLRRSTPEGDEYDALGVLLDLINPDGWVRVDGSDAYAWGESPDPLPFTDVRREAWYRRELNPSRSRGLESGYVATAPWQTLIRIGLPPCEKVHIPSRTTRDFQILSTWSRDHTVAGLNDAGMPWDLLASWIYTEL